MARIKIISCYLLDLVYTLLTCLLFLRKLIVGDVNDYFWQQAAAPSDDYLHWQISMMTLAPVSATGMEAQGVFMNVVILSQDFWELLMAGSGWLIAARILARWIVAVEWVSVVFRLGFVWFGKLPTKPPDPQKQSWFTMCYEAVYVPLVEPVLDDVQDFCWRLILYVRRIVK